MDSIVGLPYLPREACQPHAMLAASPARSRCQPGRPAPEADGAEALVDLMLIYQANDGRLAIAIVRPDW